MNLVRLSLANLAMSPLSSVVNIFLLGLGTASIAILLIATHQLTTTLTRDSAGIDLVIGAAGSPLQLVLAGVYHADIPPGNIPLERVKPWLQHPLIEDATPLALGDTYQGYRIVGSEKKYIDIYGGILDSGQLWAAPMQIVVGSAVAESTALEIGSTISGTHGLDGDGHAHEDNRFQVVGILSKTGTVLDRLLVTSTKSVWLVHGVSHDNHAYEDEEDHDAGEHVEKHDSHQFDEPHMKNEYIEGAEDQEITVVLMTYASPLAALSLPREINEEAGLQAASPAFEITRLLQIVGIGFGWLKAFAAILVASAALSIFAALYASLKARRHDLAVLRCLGATRWELFLVLFVEGMVLTIAGTAVGLVSAHGGLQLIGIWLNQSPNIALTGAIWAPSEYGLIAAILAAGFVAATLPARQAFSTDVTKTLSSP